MLLRWTTTRLLAPDAADDDAWKAAPSMASQVGATPRAGRGVRFTPLSSCRSRSPRSWHSIPRALRQDVAFVSGLSLFVEGPQQRRRPAKASSRPSFAKVKRRSRTRTSKSRAISNPVFPSEFKTFVLKQQNYNISAVPLSLLFLKLIFLLCC